MAEWKAKPIPPVHLNRYVIHDHLVDGRGRELAVIEAFDDDGPYYCNAVDPQGQWHRLGAGVSLPGARDWAERIAGLKPDRDLEGRIGQLRKRP